MRHTLTTQLMPLAAVPGLSGCYVFMPMCS